MQGFDDQTNENEKVEYQVRAVTRYVVTRWESAEHVSADGRRFYSGGSECFGEFDSEMMAYNVASALCAAEHKTLGWPQGDGRIKYPEHPSASAWGAVA